MMWIVKDRFGVGRPHAISVCLNSLVRTSYDPNMEETIREFVSYGVTPHLPVEYLELLLPEGLM